MNKWKYKATSEYGTGFNGTVRADSYEMAVEEAQKALDKWTGGIIRFPAIKVERLPDTPTPWGRMLMVAAIALFAVTLIAISAMALFQHVRHWSF